MRRADPGTFYDPLLYNGFRPVRYPQWIDNVSAIDTKLLENRYKDDYDLSAEEKSSFLLEEKGHDLHL